MNAFSIRSNEEICLPPDFRSNLTSHHNYDNNTNLAKSHENSKSQKSSFGKYNTANQQYIDYLNKSNNSNSLKNEKDQLASIDLTQATYKVTKEKAV